MLVILFLNEWEVICLHSHGFKYCYLTLKILFKIDPLFVYSQVVSSIAKTNNFICTQLNGSKSCYVILLIQFTHPVE